MANLIQLKKELRDIITNNLGNALKRLMTVLNKDREIYDEFILLKMRFKTWRSKKNAGVETNENINIEKNALARDMLQFIRRLEEGDLSPTYHLMEETHEKILVVCKSEERINYMKKLLPEEYFVNVDYSQPREKIDVKEKDIILFDNQPYEDENNDDGLLLHYCGQSDGVILYFGGFLKIINNYPEKVYATNSVFSIHARINEMIEFLKYKNASNFS